MQGVVAVVLLGDELLVANGVLAIANAVHVSAGDGIVDRVSRVNGY